RVLERGRDLRAIEPRGAVDPAIAHENDIVVVGEAARLFEAHVREAGATLEIEDRLSRTGGSCLDASNRQCEHARVGISAFFWDDQGAAVGCVAPRFRGVGAGLERHIDGPRAGRNTEGGFSRREAQITQADDDTGDCSQCDKTLYVDRADHGSALLPVGCLRWLSLAKPSASNP